MRESFKCNAHKVLSWVTGSVEREPSHASYVLSEETDEAINPQEEFQAEVGMAVQILTRVCGLSDGLVLLSWFHPAGGLTDQGLLL